ncbi:uncharacterized protein BHQ10_001114 [Talaromyces amestolkiae]|uniref:Uncharacterized protein n=1 Tax=Talaromyces amestolkiae TaxID=1196081 RepID=A0A364KNH5_TALAM|nr:uncharacterized protein BHQ10_001114 [Talaromyces amestolkiae]RAO65102.1 hypothetical protein BHQ10_001114 [Talaromyces amestolkiae]
MLAKKLPPNLSTVDQNDLQGLEERLLDLDRKILKYHDRLLEKSDYLVTATNHIRDELQILTRHLNNQTSVINSTRHIISAQARTISAQARKIRSQQEMIDVMQRDIFRLGTWYSEFSGRMNSHDEILSNRAGEVRELWESLERHTRFTEQIAKETYWMHVYTKQVMLIRASEMALIGASAGCADDGDDDGDDDDDERSDSDTAASVCTESTLITPQQHIMLDTIVVRMIEDAMPDRLKDVCDGFEVVHGCSAFIQGREAAQPPESEFDVDAEMLREDSDHGSMLV